MITEILGTLGAAFRGFAEWMGWKREEANRQNTPEMKANAGAREDAKIVDQARKDVEGGDINKIREDLS